MIDQTGTESADQEAIGFAERIAGASERRASAKRVLELVLKVVRVAEKDVTKEEVSYGELNRPRLISPKLGEESLSGKRMRHEWWEGGEGGPREFADLEITAEHPFRAQETKIDYDRGVVIFTRTTDYYNDHSFSQAGHREWVQLEVPIDQLGDLDIVEVTEE